MVDLASTIVARGCAPGRGTRAIVRLSGEGCRAIRAGLGCELPFARGARASRLRLPSGTLPCIEYVAPGPASYTGEDTLELVVVGNDDLVSEIEATALRVAAERGVTARPAAPGEFTLRAFARGRIDLTQAEGIAATIAATTDAHLRAARQLAEGGLGRFVHATADRLANDLALVEAGIDFTDQEDVVAIEPAELERHLRAAADSIRTRLARSVPWERFESTPRVVLVGAPNAGKSTLFNALLGRRRAVESATAGTTRDVIEETLAFTTRRGRCEIRLVDAAGADASATGLNPAMQTRLREAIDRADLVVECVAAPSVGCADISPARGGGEREGILAAGVAASTARDRSPSAPPGEMSAQPTEGARAAHLRITTKADLHASTDGLAVSAHTGHGLDRLREAIAAALGARLAALSDETLVLAERHESAMRAALAALDECVDLVASERLRSPELVAASLRSALDSLGTISGAIAPDDVLGRIFGSFCVGK